MYAQERLLHERRPMLVPDYKGATGSANPRDHVFGHAAYTRTTNLLFNMTAIVEHLYPA